MGIHKNLEQIKDAALYYAKEHKCNYNVILLNPNEEGEFDPKNSTYEFVLNSYFDKPRENAIIVFQTDEVLEEENISDFEDVLPKGNYIFSDKTFPITKFPVNIFKWDLPPRPPQYYREFPKIGRNDSCLCGSGKKYKNCCINN